MFIDPKHSPKSERYYSRKRGIILVTNILILLCLLAILLPQLIKVFNNNFSSVSSPSGSEKYCSENYTDTHQQKLCSLSSSGANVNEISNSNIPKYGRKKFGKAWLDVDNNGCDTRNDILNRDLKKIRKINCTVLLGELDDPYTGKNIKFQRGKNSSVIQIDHIVALQNAWINGAWEWNKRKREEFANDPLNLIAVDGKSNQEKGSKDFANWTPRNKTSLCSYAKRQITVKSKYGLKVTDEEKTALMNTLQECE